MIKNYQCKVCNHSQVCDMYEKKISIFSIDAKKQLGIDITMDKCLNFDPTGEEVPTEDIK
jgi:hypothetical protein